MMNKKHIILFLKYLHIYDKFISSIRGKIEETPISAFNRIYQSCENDHRIDDMINRSLNWAYADRAVTFEEKKRLAAVYRLRPSLKECYNANDQYYWSSVHILWQNVCKKNITLPIWEINPKITIL